MPKTAKSAPPVTAPSLSSFLLANAGAPKDDALDSLFRSSAPATNGTDVQAIRPAKRKRVTAAELMSDAEEELASTKKSNGETAEQKQARRAAKKAAKAAKRAAALAGEGLHPSVPAEDTVDLGEEPAEPAKERKQKRKSAVEVEPAPEADDVPQPALKERKKKRKPAEDVLNDDVGPKSVSPTPVIEADDDSSEGEAAIVHESLDPNFAKSSACKGTKKARELADAESPVYRAARSVFVGNVPLVCATNRSSRKAFERHLVAKIPEAERTEVKVDSIRFRGLPLPEAIGEKSKRARVPIENPNHQQRRMSAWRGQLLDSTAADEDDEAAKRAEHAHKFLTAAQKRKVAAITGDVNTNAETCIAYAVMSTAEGAKRVIATANGTVFLERTLRVDAVRPPPAAAAVEAAVPPSLDEKRRAADEERRTCFIGGLDFAETEEKLRVWVEGKIVAERGEPSAEDDEGTSEARWVERVRVIRDKDTGLGKGFAYVLFKDRDCVDELLALPPEQAKLSKRKLRFQRCKSAGKLEAEAARPAKLAAAREQRKLTSKLPKSALGKQTKRDPKLAREMAKKLEGLSKEERKAVKADDADRQARRAVKKQAKIERERAERKRAARAAKAK